MESKVLLDFVDLDSILELTCTVDESLRDTVETSAALDSTPKFVRFPVPQRTDILR